MGTVSSGVGLVVWQGWVGTVGSAVLTIPLYGPLALNTTETCAHNAVDSQCIRLLKVGAVTNREPRSHKLTCLKSVQLCEGPW